MPSPCLAGFVEEPQSGHPVPLSLEDGNKVLVGCGLRMKRVVVDIQVYVLAVYIALEDVPELSDGMSNVGSAPAGEVVLRHLLRSKADKVFQLTFLRQLTRKQVADGFSEGLANVGVCQQEIEGVAPLMPLNIQKGDVLTMTVRPAAGEVLVNGSPLQSMELCIGLQEVFLGSKAVVKGTPESARKQWNVLLEAAQKWLQAQAKGSSTDSTGSGTEEEACSGKETADMQRIDTDPSSKACGAQAGSGKRTWKEKAGRSKGKDGYKFGDITRSVFKRRVSGSPEGSSPERPAWRGPLIMEGEGVTWVSPKDVVPLDNVGLQQQRLDGNLYIFHPSRERRRDLMFGGSSDVEVLQRQWTERYFELVSGGLRWRKQLVGMATRDQCLEGCHVVVETSLDIGDLQLHVFSVLNGRDVVCRIGTPHKGMALRWILALASTCAFFHNLDCGAEVEIQKVREALPVPVVEPAPPAVKLEEFIATTATSADNPQTPPTEEEDGSNVLGGQANVDREVAVTLPQPLLQAGCDCLPTFHSQASSCCLIFMVPVMVSAAVFLGLR
mmetsp:Transcript_46270/g.107617  ORF Transcript_46270/g.107617 Transcript_46270/m.107617 type:complete len:554 (+) Transcript_46270:107-1768(+)